MRFFLAGLVLILYSFTTLGQKVGLVFSGGGAKGLAHIGVLKALEENNIPIDYISGTSMGAIVGAMYSAGYSPQEIEKIALSNDFQNWVSGRYESDFGKFYDKKPINPSFFSAKAQIDTSFSFKFRSNIINDVPLNYALLELLSKASAHAKDNFDNLFIPFRCVVSDVLSEKIIIVKGGSLAEAVRGSMSVPLVYRPIKVDNKFVFDGGLYNNFPVDVMKEEFSPDFLIGVNVSSKNFISYPSEKDDKLINRFLLYMFLSNSDSTQIGKNGVYIEPNLKNYSSTNFNPVQELIDIGYRATLADMPKILKTISSRVSIEKVDERRALFLNKNPELTFDGINVTGLNSKKTLYVKNIFNYENRSLSMKDIKKGYYKLLGDDNFETIYPGLTYNPVDDKYNFGINIHSDANFKFDFGGNISSRPISNAYFGLQYSFLDRFVYTFNANIYTGRFYESGLGAFRMDFPFKKPFFIETQFVYNRWNYYNPGELLSKNSDPDYIDQSDKRLGVKAGFYGGKNAVLNTFFFTFKNRDNYSPNNTFKTGDILDLATFEGYITGINYNKNSLNRKQYASAGKLFDISVSYTQGIEKYQPGNILMNSPSYLSIATGQKDKWWIRAKATLEEYIPSSKKYKFGYMADASFSNRPSFLTYTNNLLTSTAFYPLQDSRSQFNPKLRADSYLAAGGKIVYSVMKKADIRLEGYLFQPLQDIELKDLQHTKFGDLFSDRTFIAGSSLVYHSPIGPIAFNLNYYDNTPKKFGFLFHIGYLLYNKRAIEL
ncbi:patatin-like phospholipase family protein [Pseudopedobacter beijingensis]|uniref:Patatin-like phospholipase family protein n=1 Tax=Pseudopedobacter beijingensis TaxID=1207056 RepID=A0ABW4IHW5_9SPHI